ncbi:MAG: AbrB family transcriptional regulator, partial [Pseudomonadota bacterium]|nr:AbrB family transcriptional regulator [Pseudomonadota bacterium]
TTSVAVYIFRGLGYMDATTAYFSSTPGGLGIMVIAGEQAGADSRLIPIAHATRVFLVVFSIPLYFVTVVGVDVPSMSGLPTPATSYPDLKEIIILSGCGLAGFLLASRLGIAFGQFLIPMILSGIVYNVALVDTPLPTPVVTIAQVVIGSAIGAQFRGMRLISMFRPAIAAIGATAIMLAVAAGFAQLFSPVLNISEDALLLALAPGGLAEMSLIAISMDSDTAFIATLHIFRITMIAAAGPALFRLLRNLRH